MTQQTVSLTCQATLLHRQRHRVLWLGEGLDGEVVQSLQAGQAASGEVGELAVLDGEVLQPVQVVETSVVQP